MKTSQEMNGRTGVPRRRLGKILLDGVFVSPGDLQTAIERQRETGAQLGGILVGMGVLNGADLEAILSVQRELASAQDTIKAAAGMRELLGELLVRAKGLTPESLDEALAEQERTGDKLGNVLVRRGLITGEELDAVLGFQERQGSKKLQPSPLRLGEILVRTRAITHEKLEEALRRQKRSQRKIGEVLVESGYIKPDHLDHGLRLQQKLLTAALVGMLTFASVSPARAFDLPASRARGKMQINIAAVVKARTTMNILSQVQEIVVSNTDIDRGYIDIPAASLIEVNGNGPAGNLLTFEGLKWPFREAQIEGFAQELRISGNGGRIQQACPQGSGASELNYRFLLTENAQPGTYAWPLRITAQPL